MNTVLIVDDTKENIDGLRAILENDYKVYVATSGETALNIMNRISPDIVLLDIVMPGLSGFEVLSKMRQLPNVVNTPVIFITGSNSSYNESRGLKLGAVDYICKPYDPDIVCIKVKNHILNKMHRDNLGKLVSEKTAELTASRQALILGMSLLAEGRDKGTGSHINRMQKYSEVIAKYIHTNDVEFLSASEVKQIVLYSPLHDIGKVYVSDNILLKKGKLTHEEFETMKYHTVFGTEVLKKTENLMLSNSSTLRVAVEICEGHHEKYDGSGYPHGLKGDEIPISACIVAIADIYDALTSVREYKAALTHEQAYDIITKGDGRTMPEHFHPVVLDAFENTQDKFIQILDNYS